MSDGGPPGGLVGGRPASLRAGAAYNPAPVAQPAVTAKPASPPRKPKKRRIDLIDRVQYVGLRLVNMALHSFPVNANLRTAKLLGDFMYAIDRRHRERALANLRRSFPDLTEPQRQKL